MSVGPENSLLPTTHPLQGIPTVRVSERFCIMTRLQRPFELARADSRQHPRNIIYQIPIAYRAAAYGIEDPDAVVLGYGALALYGLPYLVEGHDVVLMKPSADRNSHGNIRRPSLVRRGCKASDVWEVKSYGYSLRVAKPAAATAQALKEIRKSAASGTFAELGRDLVEAIILIDCVRRHLGVSTAEILEACRGVVDQRWVSRALTHSSGLADSPKETEIRLLAKRVCREFGVQLEEQVVVQEGEKILTRFDLAIPELKIGIMYDGGHHNSAGQWHKDTDINTGLAVAGWRVLRFTSANAHKLVDRLTAVLREVLGAPRS